MHDHEFSVRLHECIDGALRAASASSDVKDMEPFMVDLVALVRAEPARYSIAAESLRELIPRLELENGVVDLLEYCAHTLRPKEALDDVQDLAESLTRELGEDKTLRPWRTRRLCEHIMAAAHDDWDGQDMYESLAQT